MHPDVKDAIEQIDAAFFSLTKIKEYVERWSRKISENEEWAKTHVPCTFTSVWDNGAELTSTAIYDPTTGKVEAEDSESDPGNACLVREHINLEDGTEIEVCTTCHEYTKWQKNETMLGDPLNCKNPNCESRTL
jgi:hypothetical protein